MKTRKRNSQSRRAFLRNTVCGMAAATWGGPLYANTEPLPVAARDRREVLLALSPGTMGAAQLAAHRLSCVAKEELNLRVEIRPRAERLPEGDILALGYPFDDAAVKLLKQARLEIGDDGRLRALAGLPAPVGNQAFVAARLPGAGAVRVLLAANTDAGLRNALLTLTDRLYRDAAGGVVADPLDGVHAPAFQARHIKTDAMNCGRFRVRLEYWDPASASGVNEFADWLASFRITDYDLVAFMRGWGATYPSKRFPALADPQHPNSRLNFYPQLIDRLHAWNIGVWAGDVYIASGYTMEVGTVPEMRSPTVDAKKAKPFRAGEGTFAEILGDPTAAVCLMNPRAGQYYADLVDDLLELYPKLDGLNFHTGHTFSSRKICRCPLCRDIRGNREGVYRCFKRAYEAAVARRPDIRLTTGFKMSGDATRQVVDRWEEFPRLEFFCWLRSVGDFLMEGSDAPATLGHEDGGGGLEAWYSGPQKTMAQIRNDFREYEPWIHTYVQVARRAGLVSLSWEPALHRELEQMFFLYSQLTWEPELSWAEFARRYVLRSERRVDDRLTGAYQLALEANAAATYWGLMADHVATSQGMPSDRVHGAGQRVVQANGLLETAFVRERVAALGEALSTMGLLARTYQNSPVAFDLRRSLVQSWQRMKAGDTLGMMH